MTVTKVSGMVVLLNDPDRPMSEFSEEERDYVEKLKTRYGSRFIIRDYYVKEYVIVANGEEKTVTVPYYNRTGALNRRELHQQHRIARNPLHGEPKTNAQSRTKHMRTTAERKRARARRKNRV